MYKYPVIVFEGIETSGKSTNLKIVAKYLNNINRKFNEQSLIFYRINMDWKL